MIREEFTELPPILQKVKDQGFKVFKSGDYDLNIVGLRTIQGRKDNEFDDRIFIAYLLDGKWIVESGEATTDAGRYWLTKPDYKPCAVYLHPQQARSAYEIGLHRGKYEALVQRKPVLFWRDGNKDSHVDYNSSVAYHDKIGLNIHRATAKEGGSSYVERWSAGCQVWKYRSDHERMITLCKRQIEKRGWNRFTYTLITDE